MAAAHRTSQIALAMMMFVMSSMAGAQARRPRASLAMPAAEPTVVPVDVPSWAFPLAPPAPPAKIDSITLLHVPNSKVGATDAQLHNRWLVTDWFPATHPFMPPIVSRGRQPAIPACGFCHLPDGSGRPENAMLAGLPASYIRQQLADLKSRGRESAYRGKNGPIDLMRAIADSLTPTEAADAARYFASLKPHQRSRIVESTAVPRTNPQSGVYFKNPEGGEEPLGERIIEMAVDARQHELHNAHAEYVAYVPVGSIARGRELATKGKMACTTCHGPDLRGVGVVPPIAGRPPSYIVRELVAFKSGARFTIAGRPMRTVVAPLTLNDMIAAAAYAASRTP